MREFITVMGEKTDQERADAAANIRLTKAHFDAALEKVRGSLDRDALEASERQAWEMMYNQEQRSALEEAAAVVRRAELATMGVAPENELRQQADALRRAVFARKKDFESLRDQAAALRERLDTPR